MASLYLVGGEYFLKLHSQHLEVLRVAPEAGSATRVRYIPLFDIDRVVLAGTSGMTMATVRQLMRHKVPVVLLSRTGKEIGSFVPRNDGDAGLRIRQYQRSLDTEWNLQMSRTVVQAKIVNSRRVLQKLRSSDAGYDLEEVLSELAAIGHRAARAQSQEELLGYEGAATATYFLGLRHFFPEEMPFTGRSRRPPRDPTNALFSWTYTLVLSEVRGAIVGAGLDPCIGFFHSRSPGRPSLALDLLEPLRPPLCDLFVLRLVNLRILKPDDFFEDEAGGWRLTEEGMKKFFVQYEQRMQRTFRLRGETVHTDFRRQIREMVESYKKALCDPALFSVFLMP